MDAIPPVCGPPRNVVQTVSPGIESTTVSWTEPVEATDNCGQVVTTGSTHTPGASFGSGNTVVTYDMADAHGNTVSCSFNVTIIDILGKFLTRRVGIGWDAEICMHVKLMGFRL